ncbi:MAG: hypothetical protein M9964_06275 [Solirubrobacterales bacterium]|nr:hypothetical protein [Solirubrobacterales bacterium]
MKRAGPLPNPVSRVLRALGGAGTTGAACALALLAILALALPPTAFAAPSAKAQPPTAPQPSARGATEVPSGLPETPENYGVDAAAALAAADADPKIQARREELEPGQRLTASLEAEAVNVWEVSYYVDGDKENLVIVDGQSGEVTDSFTGSAVSWPMARGREGQFGHLLNAPWVWGPLAGIFLLCLLDYRRLRKWAHLDLLVLLSFGVSQAYFNAAEIGVSVPLYYPPLVYLLARLLWIGFRGPGGRGGAGEGLRPSAPRWLLIGVAIGLLAVRIAGNMVDSGVIDVGYAGVIGADKITDAKPIYGQGSFPENNQTGDTYGPSNYFAYVPFEQVFPWSGAWDDLPAAHAAAVAFDLATLLGLYALGGVVTRRRREGLAGLSSEPGTQGYPAYPAYPEAASAPSAAPGAAGASLWQRFRARAAALSPSRTENSLGLVLTFAWLAYPYSDFALQANSNDALISALLVWSLVAFATPIARGALLGTAGLAKFAPIALLPLYLAGERALSLRRPQLRASLLVAAGFLAAAALFLAHPAVDPGLSVFYDRTIKSQLDRESPFSIWGQTDLEWLHTLVKIGAVLLGIAVAFVPRVRSLTQVAALAGAVTIAIQLTLEHWFYLYIPWFLPMLLLAMAVTTISAAPALSRDPRS